MGIFDNWSQAWHNMKNRMSNMWNLAAHNPTEIEKALGRTGGYYLGPGKPNDKVALHLPPYREVSEPGGRGPRKPWGTSHKILRSFAKKSVWLRACILLRQREVGGADWQIRPRLEHHKKELETLQQLVVAANKLEDRQPALKKFRPGYCDRKMIKELIEATVGKDLPASEVQYRFRLAYLDLVVQAESHAAPVRRLILNPNGSRRTCDDMLRPIVEDLMSIGIGAWELRRLELPKDESGRSETNNEITEVHWIDSATLRPIIDIHGDFLGDLDPHDISYEQWIDDQRVGPGFRSCDIMPIIEHPQTDVHWRGYPFARTETLINTLLLDAKGDKADTRKFDRSMYGGFLVAEDVPGLNTQEDVDAMRSWYENEVEGSYMLPILAGGKGKWNWLQTAMNPGSGDAAETEKRKRYMLRTLAVMDVPPFKLGITEDVNKATSEAASEDSDQGLSNMLDLFGTSITRAIVWDFGHDDIECVAVADNEDPMTELEKLEKEMDMCIMSVNDVRLAQNKEPDEAGDVPLVYYKTYQEEKARADANPEPEGEEMEEGEGGEEGGVAPEDQEAMNDLQKQMGNGETEEGSEEIEKALREVRNAIRENTNGTYPIVEVEVI